MAFGLVNDPSYQRSFNVSPPPTPMRTEDRESLVLLFERLDVFKTIETLEATLKNLTKSNEGVRIALKNVEESMANVKQKAMDFDAMTNTAQSYTATMLSWIRTPANVHQMRQVLLKVASEHSILHTRLDLLFRIVATTTSQEPHSCETGVSTYFLPNDNQAS